MVCSTPIRLFRKARAKDCQYARLLNRRPKISEMRQAWINDHRNAMETFIAAPQQSPTYVRVGRSYSGTHIAPARDLG
jgi:hypothetical protein